MVKEFDKKTLKTLRQDIDSALKSVADKHGLSLMLGNIRFNEHSFTGKLEARVTENPGEPTMAADFKALSMSYGIPASCLHRIVTLNGKRYKIVGLKPRNRKYPIICENVASGKRFKFSPFSIREAL